MDPTLQLVCVLIGATAAIISVIANSIKIGEWAQPRIAAFLKKLFGYLLSEGESAGIMQAHPPYKLAAYDCG